MTNISVGVKTRLLLNADQSVMEKSSYIDAVLLTKLGEKKAKNNNLWPIDASLSLQSHTT